MDKEYRLYADHYGGPLLYSSAEISGDNYYIKRTLVFKTGKGNTLADIGLYIPKGSTVTSFGRIDNLYLEEIFDAYDTGNRIDMGKAKLVKASFEQSNKENIKYLALKDGSVEFQDVSIKGIGEKVLRICYRNPNPNMEVCKLYVNGEERFAVNFPPTGKKSDFSANIMEVPDVDRKWRFILLLRKVIPLHIYIVGG